MGMDSQGEMYGSDSRQYRNQAVKQDMWLAPFIAEWMELGYSFSSPNCPDSIADA